MEEEVREAVLLNMEKILIGHQLGEVEAPDGMKVAESQEEAMLEHGEEILQHLELEAAGVELVETGLVKLVLLIGVELAVPEWLK